MDKKLNKLVALTIICIGALTNIVFAGIPDQGSKVLVRYNNFYKGDDDYFGQCLVDSSGQVTIIGQGLQTIGIHHLTAKSKDMDLLRNEIEALPKNVKDYGHTGYNFMNLSDEMNIGVVVSTVLSDGSNGYVKINDVTKVAKLVKTICAMESRD